MKKFLIIKPSTIAGVGVFTTFNLNKGELADLFEPNDCVFAPKPQPPEDLIMLNNYAIETETGWHRPQDWRRMSVGWYLNHSDTPNLSSIGEEYYANQTIPAGTELTIDYGTLN